MNDFKYNVGNFLENIQFANPQTQSDVAIKCLDRFQQSFHPDAYAEFYDYFMENHGPENLKCINENHERSDNRLYKWCDEGRNDGRSCTWHYKCKHCGEFYR